MTDRWLPDLEPALPGAERLILARSDQEWTVAVRVTGPIAGADPNIGVIRLPPALELRGFSSGPGREFQPVTLPNTDGTTSAELGTVSGRSTNGAVPWLAVRTASGWYALSLHWSGNWRLAARPTADAEGTEISVRLDRPGQEVILEAGDSLDLPAVTLVRADDLPAASAAMARLGDRLKRRHELLTEWNHWWPYEDVDINEDVFLANARVAADLGLEVAVLDAGWFGRPDAGSDWYAERGDWSKINTSRFPHGLAWLADRTRAVGIDFGIWIEPEAVGRASELADSRPELLARDANGAALGYVCLGNESGVRHVYESVASLIRATTARWVKWDFNLDPGPGCARIDHQHRPTDGLLRHYLGLYRVLDQLRSDFPDVIFESCSSGGLRIDLGLAEHVDAMFLSDPDWTEHHLNCVWGAAQFLPAHRMLHWMQSEWRGEHGFQKIDYSGSLLTQREFDTIVRAAMLHRFGVSVRLTDMRDDLRTRLRALVAGYREYLRPLLRDGVIITPTGQPQRFEAGDRQPVFQVDAGRCHLIAAFRLPPKRSFDPVRPVGLDQEGRYSAAVIDGADVIDLDTRSGGDLMAAGLLPPPADTSAIWLLIRID